MMRIVFMGTPEFAVPSLAALHESKHKVAAVITAPDKYGGRGRKRLIESGVKKYAVAHKIPVLQPKNLKNQSFLAELESYEANLQVVVAFRMLPVAVWDMPERGTMNLHASLLPAYRGAAPINWAIIRGEEKTGLTTFLLKHEIDTGDILLQKEVPILKSDTAGDLHDRMMPIGAQLVLDSVHLIDSGQYQLKPQDDTKVSKAPKIFHADCQIDFSHAADKVYNFIRGLSPYPGAWTLIDETEVKILKCRITSPRKDLRPGYIQTDQKSFLHIHTETDAIEVIELKMAGKRKMITPDFLNGYEIQTLHVQTL